jgi:hypothetical protein
MTVNPTSVPAIGGDAVLLRSFSALRITGRRLADDRSEVAGRVTGGFAVARQGKTS